MAKWVILARVFLDTGTEYQSSHTVDHPSYTYEGRVLSYGSIDRSIPVPAGPPHLGDARVRVADTDFGMRDLLIQQTPRRRLIDLRLAQAGESEATYDPFGTFAIHSCEFGPGYVDIVARDITFDWMDKRIPGLINRTNFPDLMDGVDEAFLPIITGIVISDSGASPEGPQGVIRLPRMTLTRWGLAQTPINDLVAVYRKLPGEGEFTLVDPGDYSVTEEPYTFDGIDYTLSFLDFDTDQDPGTEIQVDAEGITDRGDFGSMTAVSGTPLRNPVDFLINMLYAVLAAETRVPRFNIESFDAVRTQMEAMIGSPAEPYLCDGAIVAPITAREFISWWTTSFECDFFVNRAGEITISLSETDEDRPVFDDYEYLLRNSVRQSLASPTVNRLRYNFKQNYATREFAEKAVFDNEADQDLLGANTSPVEPVIEEDIVEFLLVRDSATATDVAARRMAYLALGSYRISVDLPLPEVFDDVELAKMFGITHVGGLAEGGYTNAEFKTTGLTYHLDRLMLTLKGVLRVPQDIPPPGSFVGDSVFDIITRPVQSLSTGEHFWNSTILEFGESWFVGDVEYLIEVEAVNQHATLPYNIYLDEINQGTLAYISTAHTFTIPANQTLFTLQQEAFTPLSAVRTYRVRMDQTASANQLQAQNMRIRVRCQGATSAAFMIPFMHTGLAINEDDLVVGDNRFTIGGSSGTLEESNAGLFLKEADAWETVTSWALQVVAGNSGFLGTNVTHVHLARASDGAIVKTTEHTADGGDVEFQSVQFAHDAENFSDDDEFTIYSDQSNTNANNTLILRVSLLVFLTGFSRATAFYPVDQTRLNIPEAIAPAENLVGVFFEATGQEVIAGTTGTRLTYTTSPAFGGSETAVAGTDIDPTSSTKTRYRTSEITMPAGADNYFDTATLGGSGTTDFSGEFVLVKFTG